MGAKRGAASPRQRSPLVRGTIWVVAVGVVALGIAGAFALVRLRGVERDLRSARELLTAAGEALEDGRLGDARAGLQEAQALLVKADGDLYSSTSLDIVGWVPVVRQNLDALRGSVGLALTVVTGGDRILDVAAPLEADDGTLEVPLREGAIPLESVAAARLEASTLAVALPGPTERPSGDFLFGAVEELQDAVFDEAVVRRDQLANLVNGLELAGELTGENGPRRYLIAVANSAEMRGTGGMILSYGVLESAGGDLTLPAFGNIDELALGAAVDPASLGVDESELRRWEGLDITRLWRNVNVVPSFEAVAPRMAAMYQAATGDPVDGVIQIDAHGLAAILEGIGPVTVPGVGEVRSDNAVALTLNEAYTLFPDRDQRQEVLGDVAEATFDRLVDGEYDSLRPLGAALLRTAAERHVIVWSARASAAGPLAFFGADGAIPPADGGDAFLLTVQNFAQNKLDYYVDTAVRITGERPAGQLSTFEVEVTVRNTAPAGQSSPRYVFGDGTGGPPGVYEGEVSLYVPVGTSVRAFEPRGGQATPPALVGEAGRSAVAWRVEVPAGEAATVGLTLELPPRPAGTYELQLAPLPRVRPTTYDVRITTGDAVMAWQGPLLTTAVLRADTPAGT